MSSVLALDTIDRRGRREAPGEGLGGMLVYRHLRTLHFGKLNVGRTIDWCSLQTWRRMSTNSWFKTSFASLVDVALKRKRLTYHVV